MAKTIKCKYCKSETIKENKFCSNCGKKSRSFFARHKILTTIVSIFVVLMMIASGGDNESTDTTATINDGTEDTPVVAEEVVKTTETKVTEKPETKITYDNFLKINMGMSYVEVVGILGEGQELSSSTIGDLKTTIYQWSGDFIDNMNVTIQDGVVVGKAQIGLSDIETKITLEKYNQVKDGMTYAQVKELLGEGEIESQVRIMDMESIMYGYSNKSGANAQFTFSEGTLTMRSQFGLK